MIAQLAARHARTAMLARRLHGGYRLFRSKAADRQGCASESDSANRALAGMARTRAPVRLQAVFAEQMATSALDHVAIRQAETYAAVVDAALCSPRHLQQP